MRGDGDSSSVRRILKRDGPRTLENLRKAIIWIRNYPPKFTPIFLPKIRWRAKKGRQSIFLRFYAQSREETHRTYPLCDQTLCATCKEGGHASILLTFLCNFAVLATQRGHGTTPPLLNTPLGERVPGLNLYSVYCFSKYFWNRHHFLRYRQNLFFCSSIKLWWKDFSFRFQLRIRVLQFCLVALHTKI